MSSHEKDHAQHEDKDKPAETVKSVPIEEYEALSQRLKELESLREKLLHSAADFENAKKRLAREKEEHFKYAQENLIRNILPVLDNLERALSHKDEQKTTLQSWISGVELVYKQLADVLKSQGLERVKSSGETFDPHLHEVVAYVQEQGKDHEIIEELEPGYLLNGRLIKAAKVRVRIPPNQEENPKV